MQRCFRVKRNVRQRLDIGVDYASPKFLAPHRYTRPLRKTERRESKRCKIGCTRRHADSPGLDKTFGPSTPARYFRHAVVDICNLQFAHRASVAWCAEVQETTASTC